MTNSIMAQEARQAATVIADQLKHNKPVCDALAETLRALQPSMIMMIAGARLIMPVCLPNIFTKWNWGSRCALRHLRYREFSINSLT